MAGVSSAMMVAPKVGTDFLASSHFEISQDPEAIHPAMKTTFMKDYIPHHFTGRPGASNPPAPAGLMHADDRHFNEKCSETAKAFEYRHAKKQVLPDPYEKLSATNFKMDRDLSKFDSFLTTHNIYFPPKETHEFDRPKPVENPLMSHVPQGDKEKELMPASDYRDRFRGHDTSKIKVPKAPNQHTGGPPTIKGDNRLHHYDTTIDDEFKGKFLPKLASYPAPRGTNVPQGDKEKENTKMTVQQESYPHHDITTAPYNKDLVSGRLGGTNFRLDDGHGAWNTYQSTATESYTVKPSTLDRNQPKQCRNHSDVPSGDVDAGRMADRVNMTTNRYYHGEYPYWFRNTIVEGSQKRTASNVWFGEPKQGKNFYDTTMESKFIPMSVPYTYKKGLAYVPSVIPLDYYGNDQTSPTTCNDFKNPRQGKTIPNPVAIENLRKTHIQPPLKGERYFQTTHLTHYTPKWATKITLDEPGKLQKSSVPLGTFN